MRKLAITAFSFSAALFLAHYALPTSWLLTAAILCCLGGVCAFFGLRSHIQIRQRVLIVLLAVSAGIVWRFAWDALFVVPASRLDGETVTITAVVAGYPQETNYGYSVDVKLRPDGGRAVGARLYYYKITRLVPGDTIEFTARFTQTAVTDDGEKLDSLTSRKILLTASLAGEITVTKHHGGAAYFPQRLARTVAEMVAEIFPADVRPFMRALLTGIRDELYADEKLSSALAVSGISHVVAISGMHISFLMGFLGVFIKRKRVFAAIAMPVLLLFMAMTGFTPSVTRAGIMQMILMLAPLVRRESDGLTSLAAALFLILAGNPYACGSVGLQLSFAATLGIILFTEKLSGTAENALRDTRLCTHAVLGHAVRFITASLATTLGALVLTVPLTALHFGYISLVAPLTNLLTLWAVSLAFPGGLIACILGFIFEPLGSAAAYPVTLAARYIIAAAKALASVPNAAVYLSNTYIIPWLVYVYMMLITLAALRVRARRYLLPACLAVVSLCVILLLTPLGYDKDGTSLTALDVGQGQSLVIRVGDYTAMVDCGGTSGKDAGEIACEYLAGLGCTSVDLLVLTHFHADHVNGVEYLLSRVHVTALAIPDPEGSDDALAVEYAEDIIALARRRGADIIYVTETLRVSLGATDIIMYPPLGEDGENERGLSVLCYGELTALITGDMDSAGERRLLRYARLPQLDVLVVGHHGSKYSTSEEILGRLKPRLAIISVGRNNYGHPAEETLSRLRKYGVTVIRTDLVGTVTV